MPERSSMLAPAHILSYGSLLGFQSYQTFVSGIIAFRTLPRPQFSTLQSSIFPVYFGLQTAVPLVLALTYPGEKVAGRFGTSGLSGVFSESNRWNTLVPIMTTFLSGITNLLVIQPATAKVMRQRKEQESIDGKKYTDAGPHSKEMMKLNKSFGKLHQLSAVVNLAALAATIYYGVVLAERVN
ncbi:hypothetical protein H112_08474 [Trichophyton rubrum D6]|uniref:TMEM205-like domain-containing protein n=5 Tax=Trichophyton TaxID=5550 RepID=A0A178ETF6_TRIRU|nr:uncharacterized protein TERG_01037 [Trichophyton rubrum CBS 118892]EZF10281.1 hypothetical protein H100_08496 [Trichophyton rubrum MR850]EZF37172.1 hypothetical protein H102_08455 [Trichophyton rubrum CBS 100081]EZF47735.1 hypothetical protein H103_08478 [Trichophyton rubrum CBS 288.86]EZF58525.1 hypothetical protein H104_08431 [Trichophyton rubrum CBS 289.86]EZF68931.1 hypothetical protein H105_08484 [Trichophyton soudanense CBS 452.61]EZF79653.1 hypothetical protein H110_08481 [Trichophy